MSNINYWSPENFEVSSMFNMSNRENIISFTNGSDTTCKCKYTFNELGFRGDSIYKEGFKIMSIGCSITEGVGVNDNETWSHLFSKMIANGVDCNFAYGGRSNDYISRCLISYYDMVKPDIVLIMYTEPNRRDFFTNDGGIEPYHSKGWGYFSTDKGKSDFEHLVMLSNFESDVQNWYRNHLLIKYFLESKKCNWLWNGCAISNEDNDKYYYTDENRFDGDFSTFIDYGVDNCHPGPKTHKTYSLNLFNYIKEKFPHYIKYE